MKCALIGFMGVGKTSVGQTVGETLGLHYMDLDASIESAVGNTLPEIFEVAGEKGFRKLETELLRQDLFGNNVLLACGGGTPMFKRNRRILQERGCTVIYLRAKEETLAERLEHDGTVRPLLQTPDGGIDRKKLHRLLKRRERVYRKTADFTVDTDGKSVAEIAREVIRCIK